MMEWHETQNEQISNALKCISDAYNHSLPIRRIWAISESLLLEKHFINICALYKQNDRFRILDVGCGTGALIYRLSNYFRNAEFVGIDSNEDSIGFATSHSLSRCKYVKGTFDDANLLGKFDIVVCSEVFEHVLDTDRLLNILCAVCKSGGFISISTPSGWMYRRPSFYVVYKLFKSPKKYFKYCLFPERNWA
jgi:2-polyprenyl-3-methyl-5-hydroxy-6-metoxy-1,4-benzoquinol methylase